MNIFILDEDIQTNVCYYNDKHLVKMQLESAQLLCTAVVASGGTAPYKPTHMNHPCSIWVRQSIQNFLYLTKLAICMEKEWKYRFNKSYYVTHKSVDVIRTLGIPNLPDIGLTPFALAMPDKYKRESAVVSYRTYYAHEKDWYKVKNKPVQHTWTKRERPAWLDMTLYPV